MAGEETTDVAVIGGGPAGATAARLLAAWGHDVTLLTRPASRHALAESLPPSCAKLFDRVGIRREIDAAGFVRSTGNTVRWADGEERVERFGSDARGYQVPRDAFDRLVLAGAEASGVRVRRRATVHDARPTVVRYEMSGRAHRLDARWVLDCSGRTGIVARRMGRRPEAGARTVAVAAIWERPDGWTSAHALPDETHTLVEGYADGWGWSVPASPTRRCVAVMIDPTVTMLAGRGRLGAVYRGELARMSSLRALTRDARMVGSPWARDASSYTTARVADDGVLVVGDAASFIDPLSSYGVKKAMASAWLAAVVAHTCLVKAHMLHPALNLFASRETAIYDGLRRRLAELSRQAAGAYGAAFWGPRAASPTGERVDDDAAAERDASTQEPDVAALRRDPDVLAAFAALKARPSIRLAPAPALRRITHPTVRGNEVVVEEHLVAPSFPSGVRYVRDIDLVTLVALAPAHDQVPDLYAAYNRAAPPASLPDFLGALSMLVGKGMLALEP